MARKTAINAGVGRGAAWAAVAFAAVLGAAAALGLRPSPAPSLPTGLLEQEPPAAGAALAASAATPPTRPVTASAPRIASAGHRPRLAVEGAADAAASAADKSASKWARVNALIASGRPADAFEAYKILSMCSVVQSLQEAVDDSGDPAERADRSRVDEQCGDLSPGQLSERVRLLEAAADAHVPGAVAALMNQGPDGESVSDVWDDPAFADWKRSVLERVEAEADRGDAVALQMMISRHDSGQESISPQDSAAALRYYTAYVDVELATDPIYASPTRRESLTMQARRLSDLYAANLTPEQAQTAIASGHALAAPAIANAARPGP